ncbi:transketolase family protein [Corynebacterium epidermidicanis]|uniref:Transketolase, alpha subunit n=1 Tax=Corynebacterium epidermidicanis TaxID=1050174 RepID=A0A0G3GPE9_9CORY|nr:hypothetical protein [Corynebacterium epidermidicanis]AKK03106.1 transketolase, alpha subunit [Corynebacterium epidermidicanis]
MNENRELAIQTVTKLLAANDKLALVWAEISGRYLGNALAQWPERVINVGIREQLLISVGAGLALDGMRPIMHTFSSFLLERAFEQIKIGFGHQDLGGVLLGIGGSFDYASSGRTHQCPEDIALMLTLPGIEIHTPSSKAETTAAIEKATGDVGLHYVRIADQRNSLSPAHPLVHDGNGPTIVACAEMLDPVLAVAELFNARVVHFKSSHKTELDQILKLCSGHATIVVEPWLDGSLSPLLRPLFAQPESTVSFLGITDPELRRYGTAAEHTRAHGLDAINLSARISELLSQKLL